MSHSNTQEVATYGCRGRHRRVLDTHAPAIAHGIAHIKRRYGILNNNTNRLGTPRATGYVCTRRRISTTQLDLWTSMHILQFFHIGGRSIHKLDTRPGKFTSNLLHLRWRQQAHSFPSRVILCQSVKDDSPDVQIDPHANRITRHQHLQTSTFTCSATCTTRHKHI
jgi:hypothetical protein